MTNQGYACKLSGILMHERLYFDVMLQRNGAEESTFVDLYSPPSCTRVISRKGETLLGTAKKYLTG